MHDNKKTLLLIFFSLRMVREVVCMSILSFISIGFNCSRLNYSFIYSNLYNFIRIHVRTVHNKCKRTNIVLVRSTYNVMCTIFQTSTKPDKKNVKNSKRKKGRGILWKKKLSKHLL